MANEQKAAKDKEELAKETQALVDSVVWWKRYRKRHDLARAASTIVLAGVELAALESRGDDGKTADERASEAQTCHDLLQNAEQSLTAGDIDSAWASLQMYERRILSLLNKHELAARWTSAITEAQDSKVGGWRSLATSKLPQRLRKDPAENIANLREVLRHIHTAAQNNFNKNSRIRTQLIWAAVGVGVLVLAAVILNHFGFFADLGPQVQQTLPLAVFSGLLGGVLSVAYTVVRSDRSQRIPEVRASFAVTIVRPVIGAAIALPIMFFMESGLIIEAKQQWVVLGLCFLGGFSEQWFLGLVERIESST